MKLAASKNHSKKPTQMFVPLSQPNIGEEEIKAVTETLRSSRLALGPRTETFEQAFAAAHGVKYGITVNAGTSGLHLAIRALGITEGDEVITTPFSFIASANCILFEKATPVFVDIQPDTFNIDPNKIEAAITPRTKAILPVHVFGQCADMERIMEIAKKHKLNVIEDACEAPLAKHMGQFTGSFGDCAVYGFYPNKQMTTGEGGMIITDDENLYHLCRSLRNQGRGDNIQWLNHPRLGYNYRISEITAAIGLVQTQKLPGFIKKRQELAAAYSRLLQDIDGIQLPVSKIENEHSWFVYPLRVDSNIRDSLIEKLNQRGVQSKAYFFPCIHLQEFYMKKFGYQTGDFPIAEQVSNEILILPFFTQMTEKQMLFVVEKLKMSMGEIYFKR
jgi:perosamine synthetase